MCAAPHPAIRSATEIDYPHHGPYVVPINGLFVDGRSQIGTRWHITGYFFVGQAFSDWWTNPKGDVEYPRFYIADPNLQHEISYYCYTYSWPVNDIWTLAQAQYNR